MAEAQPTPGQPSWAQPSTLSADSDPITQAALRARAGDRAAAAQFVQQTQADVWRLCAHLGSYRDAEDLVQETYARAFASLHRFAARSSARTWLFSIARRVCADAIRNRKPLTLHAELAPEGNAADPADTVAMTLLLTALDRDFREAFVLTQVLALSYQEAADVLKCPVGTVRSRVSRARQALVRAATADQG